jgi:hypothetical protein
MRLWIVGHEGPLRRAGPGLPTIGGRDVSQPYNETQSTMSWTLTLRDDMEGLTWPISRAS